MYRSITEIDTLVVKQTAKGKLEPTLMESVKTGKSDSPEKAKDQNTKAVDALDELRRARRPVRIFERTAKTKLGKDLTPDFDLANLGSLTTQTRGLPGKGFDETLDLGVSTNKPAEARELLESVVRLWIQLQISRNPGFSSLAGKQ